MKFEKQMKKHIDEVLEENVPNPYSKKKPAFPHWLKIAIPTTTGVLAASIALAVAIPYIGMNKETINKAPDVSSSSKEGSKGDITPSYVYEPKAAAPKQSSIPQLDTNIVKRTATKSLANLEYCFAKAKNTNMVISPASFLLAASGFTSVSEGFDLDAFGLVDAQEDVKALLDNWNSYYVNNNDNKIDCQIDSGVLHQQVGPTFQFDRNKISEIEDAYIGVGAAPLNGYVKQAEDYFKEKVGLTIPVPDLDLQSDGVITYGAISLLDRSIKEFPKQKNDFVINGTTVSVDTGLFGVNKSGQGISTKYYECDTYETFILNINVTSLLIVLPKEGVSIDSVSISEAYTNGVSAKTSKDVYGYVPFFHLQTFGLDVAEGFTSHLTGQEKYYSKLVVDELKDHVDLELRAIQNSDFCFNEYGVAGQSITAMGGSSSIGTKLPTQINVNRPFYAISLKDNFPLFVNKVNDPRQN